MNMKWKTIGGLILIYLSILMNWEWIWGILFVYWVIVDLVTQTVYFIEPIDRFTNPILYWLVVATWLFMGVYYLLPPLTVY